MGLTITEKILARAAGRGAVEPGDILRVKVDLVMGHDVTLPLSILELGRMGAARVFDAGKVVAVSDHFAPASNVKAAEQIKAVRDFARDQGLVHHFEPGCGQSGVCHALLPEEGLILPGYVVVGADSHTTTYGALGAFGTGMGSTDIAAAMALGETWLRVPQSLRLYYHGQPGRWICGKDLILHTLGRLSVAGAIYKAMEFCGPVIEKLAMSDRFTMCNMAVEAGAKNGIIAPDATTEEYLKGRVTGAYEPLTSDSDACYAVTYDFDCQDLEPQVAFPFSPDNVRPVQDAAAVAIDAVIIGSCTNGRLEDLRVAGEILRGRKVARGVRLIVIPATQRTYLEALKEGLLEVFAEAGAAVGTPTCGPCFGGHMGLLAAGERAVSTTNRNFVGRMGHPESQVYLASPAVAAASAVLGRIAHPEEVAD
ncbi:MAG TPA: 3-isopropylmalate dehydratase large subunit [Anaerolineae bacterium]|nr:3-isopropylmalate dehydratase large subunit [Anaerolineae bacterium]